MLFQGEDQKLKLREGATRSRVSLNLLIGNIPTRFLKDDVIISHKKLKLNKGWTARAEPIV
jgi:hypothetical protein